MPPPQISGEIVPPGNSRVRSRKIPRVWKYVIFLAQKSMVLDDFEPTFIFYGEVPDNNGGWHPAKSPGAENTWFSSHRKVWFWTILSRLYSLCGSNRKSPLAEHPGKSPGAENTWFSSHRKVWFYTIFLPSFLSSCNSFIDEQHTTESLYIQYIL